MKNNNNKFRPDLQGVEKVKCILKNDVYVVTGTRKDECPKCCRRTNNIKDYKIIRIKSNKYKDKEVILEIRKQRYVCSKCKKTQSSELEFIKKRCRISNDIKNQIENDLYDMKSLKQIAKDNKVSTSTVIRILDNKEIAIDSNNLPKPIGLHVNEYKGNAENEKYQLAIYDENHNLVNVLKDRKSKTISNCLNNQIDKSELQFVVIDMFMQFRNAINKELDVKIIADNFHFTRQVDWMVGDIQSAFCKTSTSGRNS